MLLQSHGSAMMKDQIILQLKEKISTDIFMQPGLILDIHQPLISSGLIDSFSLVDIALFVEDTFDVQIDDTELNAETFDSLIELTELILSRME
jgi:acyl carrier protein